MREFAFELELCAALEERRGAIVARQLGASVAEPGGRIVDVALIEPGPAFERRLSLAAETIPEAAIEADVGPGRWTPWRSAFDCHPERAARAVDRAVEIGFFERERREGRDCVRQVARYPDWIGGIVGIENKPDLATPGELERQLRTDVSLGLVDRAILATESHVTGAHLHRIPESVGVWRLHRGEGLPEIEVIRDPEPLSVAEPGIEPLAFEPGRTDVAVVPTAAKRRARRRLAERAYGKGWRTFGFPACGACEPVAKGGDANPAVSGVDAAVSDGEGTPATLPYCRWKGRLIDAATECGPACAGFEPAESLDVSLTEEREQRTPWRAEPSGVRRQVGLDRFGE